MAATARSTEDTGVVPDHYDAADQLRRWGPESTAPGVSIDEANRYTRWLAGSHYENFHVVTRLFPRHLRQDLANVYAYCRWSDDLADETGDRERSRDLLAWWEESLDAMLAGATNRHPVFCALSETVRRHRVSREPLADLISAFSQDQRVLRYRDFAALRDYCRRSADPVGRLVLRLLDRDSADRVALSDSTCTGLQLANFCQDVAGDARRGRLYVPTDECRAAGIDPEELVGSAGDRERLNRIGRSPAFAAVMRRQADRAREHLLAGLELADGIPGRVGTALELFPRGGLAILRKIEEVGYNVLLSRPSLSGWDKTRTLVATLSGRWIGSRRSRRRTPIAQP